MLLNLRVIGNDDQTIQIVTGQLLGLAQVSPDLFNEVVTACSNNDPSALTGNLDYLPVTCLRIQASFLKADDATAWKELRCVPAVLIDNELMACH